MAEENIESQMDNSQVNEPTPVELQARDSGWVPKEEYKGEEHKWVDAGEFLRRGELFKKIEDQSKQLKDVRNALNEMKKLHGQVREVEYKRALDALREQKKQALIDGDADAVISVDERIDLVKDQQRELAKEPPAVQESTEHPEFTAWTERNGWYKASTPMRAFADALGRELASAGNSPSEVLKKVEAEVKKEFPHKFQNPNQGKPGAVESGRGTRTTSTGFVMTDEERRIMNTFVRTGALTEAKYIEDLKKTRG